jgi:RimJ/RimL family protein N-acetyltransferase
VLRAHETGDYEDLLAMWSDADVVRHIGGRPSTADEVWTRLLRYGGLWPLLGFGYWRIGERRSDRYVGDAGIADFRRGLGEGFDGWPETGWAILPWAQGQGLAAEAMTAVLRWADQDAALPRTVCIISPQNTPSSKLAARLGYRSMGLRDFRGSDTELFERLRG